MVSEVAPGVVVARLVSDLVPEGALGEVVAHLALALVVAVAPLGEEAVRLARLVSAVARLGEEVARLVVVVRLVRLVYRTARQANRRLPTQSRGRYSQSTRWAQQIRERTINRR